MKRAMNITAKFILKAIVFILLPIFSVANFTLKIFAAIFRFLSIPIAIVGLLVTILTYFDSGYDPSLLKTAGIFLVVVVSAYLLPLIPAGIDRIETRMKHFMLCPIIVRSPVKYTL